jgi:hypothetical protein
LTCQPHFVGQSARDFWRSQLGVLLFLDLRDLLRQCSITICLFVPRQARSSRDLSVPDRPARNILYDNSERAVSEGVRIPQKARMSRRDSLATCSTFRPLRRGGEDGCEPEDVFQRMFVFPDRFIPRRCPLSFPFGDLPATLPGRSPVQDAAILPDGKRIDPTQCAQCLPRIILFSD